MRVLLAAVVLLGFGHAGISTADIGLFADPNCSSSNLCITPPNATGTFYVRVTPEGLSPDFQHFGFDGAEFRVEGLPPGWIATVTPNPIAILSVGNPLGDGANIAFSPLQPVNCALLYTVTLRPPSPGAQAILHVTQHLRPSNPNWPCALVAADFGVLYLEECVNGGTLNVNTEGACSVAAEPRTWSHVKRLFE